MALLTIIVLGWDCCLPERI